AVRLPSSLAFGLNWLLSADLPDQICKGCVAFLCRLDPEQSLEPLGYRLGFAVVRAPNAVGASLCYGLHRKHRPGHGTGWNRPLDRHLALQRRLSDDLVKDRLVVEGRAIQPENVSDFVCARTRQADRNVAPLLLGFELRDKRLPLLATNAGDVP